MKRIVLYLIATVAVCGAAKAQDTLRITLDSCLNYAYSHNITVQNAGLQREAAAAALE